MVTEQISLKSKVPEEDNISRFRTLPVPLQILLICVPVFLGGWAVEIADHELAEVVFAAIKNYLTMPCKQPVLPVNAPSKYSYFDSEST